LLCSRKNFVVVCFDENIAHNCETTLGSPPSDMKL
jgi:hypothetical protein